MKLLSNFDVFKEYYDLDTKQFCSFESAQKNVGTYKIIGNIMIGLLVEDKELYFLYGNDKFLITESYRVLIKERSKLENEFTLLNGNDVIVRFLYPLPDPKLNISPFEYIDEDDFKWGDFIEKIVNNPERRKRYMSNR
jgi:hypothetical protein